MKIREFVDRRAVLITIAFAISWYFVCGWICRAINVAEIERRMPPPADADDHNVFGIIFSVGFVLGLALIGSMLPKKYRERGHEPPGPI